MKEAILPAAVEKTPSSRCRRPPSLTLMLLVIAALGSAVQLAQWTRPFSVETQGAVRWRSCGGNLHCTNVVVPLDWQNHADPRTVSLNVVRSPAHNQSAKLGTIFFNPGGPGGSGAGYIAEKSPFFHALLRGRYDLIGWDPRGVNLTSDHVTCHVSALDQYLYDFASPVSLDLPARNYRSDQVVSELESQIRTTEASARALFDQCAKRSGDSMAYAGTRSVVRDLDFMASTIAPGEKMNYWGMSYGTIIGQYMTSLLPPERLGLILLDGVVNVTMWNTPTDHVHPFGGLSTISAVLNTFARSCSTANDSCALSHLGSKDDILSGLTDLVDGLYDTPLPATNAPGFVARARHARQALFASVYSIKSWPATARAFDDAMNGNATSMVAMTAPKLPHSWAEAAKRRDTSGNMATAAIRCADLPPSGEPPLISTIAEDVLTSLDLNSPLVGDQFYALGFCHLWPIASKSYYNGTFDLVAQDIKLRTPVLVLNQREDPVTPLSAAEHGVRLLGGKKNARLVTQNGSGHCVISQASLCTAKIIRAYFLDGEAPEKARTVCEVDEMPFEDAKLQELELDGEEGELLEAWKRLGDDWPPRELI